MTPRWRIAPMEPRHVASAVAIEEASFLSPWPEEAFQPDPERPYAISFVLLDEDRPEAGVRGYVCLWALEGEVTIHDVAVHPEDRRRGGGRRLVEAALAEGRRRGGRVAWLEVRPSNGAALSLYRSLGFAAVARRAGYYDNGEDAIVMRADIGAGPARDPAAERFP